MTSRAKAASFELRYFVAVRVSYDLSLLLHTIRLQEAVIGHLALRWAEHLDAGGSPRAFEQFYRAYRTAVERGVDPVSPSPAEYQRVWLNHARLLRGQADLVRPGPN